MEAVGAYIFGDFSLLLRIEAFGLLEVVLHEELISGTHDCDLRGYSLLHEVPD